MTTFWRYRDEEGESSPVPFSELVELARQGAIERDDLVRAEWLDEWQRAETVPGLFHMARRPVAEPAAIDESDTRGEETAGDSSREALGHACLQEISSQPVRACETSGLPGASWIASIAAAAAKAQERREAKRRRVPLRDRLAGAFGETVLEHVLRWGCALVAANLAAFALLRWSETETLRFPGAEAAEQLSHFPWWGPCSPLEYGLLLGDTMLLFGALGYGLARVLELWVDR